MRKLVTRNIIFNISDLVRQRYNLKSFFCFLVADC